VIFDSAEIDAQTCVDAAIIGFIVDRSATFDASRNPPETCTVGFLGIWRPDNRPFTGAERLDEPGKQRRGNQNPIHRTLLSSLS
jgi:hypothetical protein